MSFEEARKIVRQHAIQSVTDYERWWNTNRPARIPKRPDRAYHRDFISWGDFLGVHNAFSFKRQKFLPYEQAKVVAHKLNLKSILDWRELCSKRKVPKGLPTRPDVVYETRGEWISWRDFLGYAIDSRIDSMKNTKALLCIIKYNSQPGNVVTILTLEENNYSTLIEELKHTGGKMLFSYVIPKNGIWRDSISKHCKEYAYGGANSYIVTEAIEFFSFLADTYIRYDVRL
jgi:hypothetical protein